MLRRSWNASRAFIQRSEQSIGIRPVSATRPILDALSMAAAPKGDSAESSILGSHPLREAQKLSSGGAQASLVSPSKRLEKLIRAAAAHAEIRGGMDSGRRLNLLRQTDLSTPCVSSGLRCWVSSAI